MAAVGLVKASVPFSAGVSFDYVLESSQACVDPSAFLSNNVLTISLPEEKTRQWAASDEVSISAEQALDDGQSLKILVEKDFSCLAPRDGEDESDMFEHPESANSS
jgi:hypothetical protein